MTIRCGMRSSSVAMLFLASFATLTAQNPANVTNEELQKLYANLPIAKLTTPRAGGHPDLSGVWINPFPATSESENGTIRFDIGGARPSAKYPLPAMPPISRNTQRR